MLFLNAEDVRHCLPMAACIEAMKKAFLSLIENRVQMPLRTQLSLDCHDGTTLVMPAWINEDSQPALAVKIVSVFDRNPIIGHARIQAAVVVLEPQTGCLKALIEGSSLTGIRTAAVSGAATDLLARKDSRTLAILGSGVQARTHIEAMCAVRPIETVWIYAPTSAHVESLILELTDQGAINARLHAADSAASAVSQADIICTTTTSAVPVFHDEDLQPGVHINAVGSYTPEAREIPSETVVRARVIVDDRHAAWTEAGDLIQPLESGVIDREHVLASLGELVAETAIGRAKDQEITLFKSVGLAVQDAMAARLALLQAALQQRGQILNG